ncbi:MAG: hypothetical protein IJC27_07755 [Lentisphaeria bacterium]|nr:hypothetical protein [Lentisphaeria bacterium]
MKRLWFSPPDIPEGAYITVYRSVFTVDCPRAVSFDFSADERAQLFLDGKRLIDGPERGAPEHWYFQRASFEVAGGTHTLTVRVLSFGFCKWAYGQLSVRHGFWIDEKSGILNNWECQIEDGCTFEAGFPDWGAFPRVHLTEEHNPLILEGKGGIWRKVAVFEDERELFPPDLPLMRYERIVPQDKGNGLFYFPEYVCAWAEYRFSGRGRVKIRWSETPYLDEKFNLDHLKGNKGRRDGKFFVGNFDTFEIDGELHWFDYWWHAGHYCQILTEGEVTVQAEYFRTGYPYEGFVPADKLEKMAFETLQACSFETYMDCPYYEQLMYIGDSRLEAVCSRLISSDDRLPRKALKLLSLSQQPDGSLLSQYPSRSKQVIPSFMLIWVLMLHDHFKANGKDALTLELLVRAGRLMEFMKSQEVDGLISVKGWNFIDWCNGGNWDYGTPPGGAVNSIINFLYVLALQAMAEISGSSACRKKAQELLALLREKFFDREQGFYAIDTEHRFYSEHSQVLALLAEDDHLLAENLRKNGEKLVPCSIYFSFYYFQVCLKYGMDDLAEKRLDNYRALENQGLTTLPEEFENPRSDCHAWSSHILAYLLNKKR